MALPDSKIAETERIRREYARRARQVPEDFYALYREENLYAQSQISRACLRLFRHAGVLPLSDRRIADIGCGVGHWLLEFLQWGAVAENVYGIDLLQDRIAEAQKRLIGTDLMNGDAQQLPWPDDTFDLVTQFTLFSSVLDVSSRQQIAREMQRVLRPGGHILWFDMNRNNPRNSAVRGISRSEIQALFPNSRVKFRTAVLVPPIARLVAGRFWAAALALEQLPFARTHLLALITPA